MPIHETLALTVIPGINHPELASKFHDRMRRELRTIRRGPPPVHEYWLHPDRLERQRSDL